jgi:DNA ligase (NAD+)
LRQASEQTLQAIYEIGPEVAKSLCSFFANPQNQRVLDQLLLAGISLENPLYTDSKQEKPFQDQTFVFTGRLQKWTRDEAKEIVERLGGRATNTVTDKTNYVVAGPGAGSKLDKAKNKGIQILNEEDFAQLVGREVTQD